MAGRPAGGSPGLLLADVDDELSLVDTRPPGLAHHNALDRGQGGPARLVDALEVVQASDHVSRPDPHPAGDDLLVSSAVRLDGQLAMSLVSDRTPPELFSEGIPRLASSRTHGHLPEKGLRLRDMLPGHARCGSLHAHTGRTQAERVY